MLRLIFACFVIIFIGGCGTNPSETQNYARSLDEQKHELFLKKYLRPVVIENCEMKRYGELGDGGYLMCGNLMSKIKAAYSYGINGYDGWGCQIARELNITTHQYDPFNTTRPLCENGTVSFHKEGIASHQFRDNEKEFQTLTEQIAANGYSDELLVVKIDVEDAEWDALLATPDKTFQQIAQLVIEIHWLYRPEMFSKIQTVLKKLDEHFYVVHIHSNNYSCISGKGLTADVLEVSYVNKSLTLVSQQSPRIPNPLDVQNDPVKLDCPIQLKFFQ